jgi:hypothetical protein
VHQVYREEFTAINLPQAIYRKQFTTKNSPKEQLTAVESYRIQFTTQNQKQSISP